MTKAKRVEKLKHFITCLKCEVSGKCCDNNCPTQYNAGNMGEIIENLEEIAKALEQEPITKNEARYCDRNTCLKNEYNNVGCEDCEVTKSQELTTQERQAESDKFDAAFQDGYDQGYAQARFDYDQEPTTKNDLGVDLISRADVNRLICEYRDDATETGNERDLERAYGANAVGELISELPSITPQEPILDKVRAQIKSNLRGVEIALEVLVENHPLRPKMEGAKDTLKECLELIDKAESEGKE